ncbi:EAL domain-containing protein [Acinetobacter bereziniae]|uniref:bifunctional diguanylate cyclase/phosphodiesterase n=1 Tax=Acinetobacter bereziniae TaxID=106648 RepID=UPI0021CD2566|nr:EAL domain-containing protein [Acinetobacter bereziniae]MCU4539594.1 EAL domain-containing protein [Acinetobacter bereziniae]MCU4624227.1 EAL domain-containing protein [Acinetobacter bereziniae]
MSYMSYDSSLVIGSACIAVIICYIAISLEQLIFTPHAARIQKVIICLSGMALGFAIWAMHFVGMLACHLPENHTFDLTLTVISYIIATLASIFAVWLTTQDTLPLPRLILGALLMGLGIAGMHYVGMMGLEIPNQQIYYHPILVILSVTIAISGSGLSFWLAFKYKNTFSHKLLYKAAVSIMIALSIVGMHYTGMAAATFSSTHVNHFENQLNEGQGVLLFTIIFVASLILVSAFCVAILERRLEERSLQLIQANKELEGLALQDNLTKLPNRLFLVEYTDALFLDYKETATKIAFVYIDLDRFKSVNDAFGHHIGDELLVKFAQRLYPLLTEGQKLIRIGGDEFILILEDSSRIQAEHIAELFLQKIQDSFQISGKEINISASIGIVFFPDHGQNLQDLLINADSAMMQSKEQRRNTYSVYSCSLDQQHHNRSQSKLINDLYKAVEEQQFILFYQPKFTADYRICGVEALIRWKHPSLGLLAPSMFIGGAEQTGLIIRMGYWALEQACMQIQQWEQKNYAFCPVAVNLSAVQFEHKHLIGNLEKLIQKYHVKHGNLIIEITESTAMHHIDDSIQTFEKLRNLGIKLAIDDFGTGHSSFLYLKDLPVDELKIDREFIRNLCEGSKEQIILESIIHLAIRLGLVVTAEGVETEQQAQILKRLGCQQLQGYLLGMPLPVDRLEANYHSP